MLPDELFQFEPDLSEHVDVLEVHCGTCRHNGNIRRVALNLQALASMSYSDFRKIIDEERKIDQFQWFKNANLFYGLQDEIKNINKEKGV